MEPGEMEPQASGNLRSRLTENAERCNMQTTNGDTPAFTPEESWSSIHMALDGARSSMYMAGTASILLLWGVLISLGFLSQYAVAELAPGFAESYPWFPAPLWGIFVSVGMVCSAFIGHQASGRYATGEAARNAGIRVFLYWLVVVVAAFVIPLMAGMWTAPTSGMGIAHVTVGIVSLGYVLFGIMHRPVIAVVGVGIAGAFYIPSYVAGDTAPVLSAVAMLLVAALGAFWIHRSGLP